MPPTALTSHVRRRCAVSNNTADHPTNPSDCHGTFVSFGRNVLGSGQGCTLVPSYSSGHGDQVGVDPELLPLADNGGWTRTHALPQNSVAVDTGSPDAFPHLDQRAYGRPVDGDYDGSAARDVGAYERGASPLKIKSDVLKYFRTKVFTGDLKNLPALSYVLRGDANGDGATDLSDGLKILDSLFRGREELPCRDAADANDDGDVDISDGVLVLEHLFKGESTLPGPRGCGVDITDDRLGCRSSYCMPPEVPDEPFPELRRLTEIQLVPPGPLPTPRDTADQAVLRDLPTETFPPPVKEAARNAAGEKNEPSLNDATNKLPARIANAHLPR